MALAVRRKQLVVFAVILAAVGGYLLYQWIRVSPEEKIRRVLDNIFAAIGRADVDGVMEHVSPDYRGEEVDRETLRRMAERFFESFGPTEVTVRRCNITAEGYVGVAELGLSIDVARETRWGRRMGRSSWRLSFVRYGKRWYVERIAPVSVGGYPFESLRSLATNIPSSRGF